MFLQLLDHLANAEQLLNSPQAASLLLAPIPGSKSPPQQTSAEDLVKGIQASMSMSLHSNPCNCSWQQLCLAAVLHRIPHLV